MIKQRIFLILAAITAFSLSMSGETASGPDRIEIKGGTVLTGRILEASEETIRIETDYAGTLEVLAERIERVVTDSEIALPSTIKVASGGDAAPQNSAALPAKKPKPAAAPQKFPAWEFEAGMNLTGSQGNSEKLDLGLTLDARYKRKYDRFDFYGTYSYGTNRGKESANELIAGSRYTNFFYDRLGFFLREELEHDKDEGIYVRSTTAGGLSWRVHNDDSLAIEARSGVSYRYEDYDNDGYEDFPGMDFGMDINWKFAPWMQFKGSYAFIPSIDDFEQFILKQDTGINVPLEASNRWKLRFGLVSKYNNQPDGNRDKLDHRYYARLVASWK